VPALTGVGGGLAGAALGLGGGGGLGLGGLEPGWATGTYAGGGAGGTNLNHPTLRRVLADSGSGGGGGSGSGSGSATPLYLPPDYSPVAPGGAAAAVLRGGGGGSPAIATMPHSGSLPDILSWLSDFGAGGGAGYVGGGVAEGALSLGLLAGDGGATNTADASPPSGWTPTMAACMAQMAAAAQTPLAQQTPHTWDCSPSAALLMAQPQQGELWSPSAAFGGFRAASSPPDAGR
jgi:hypothetical protein